MVNLFCRIVKDWKSLGHFYHLFLILMFLWNLYFTHCDQECIRPINFVVPIAAITWMSTIYLQTSYFTEPLIDWKGRNIYILAITSKMITESHFVNFSCQIWKDVHIGQYIREVKTIDFILSCLSFWWIYLNIYMTYMCTLVRLSKNTRSLSAWQLRCLIIYDLWYTAQ